MPLIRPEISSILRNAGIRSAGIRPPGIGTGEDSDSVTQKLEDAGLSVTELFHDLRSIVDSAELDQVKLNAIKTALEAHRITKGDAGVATQVVNIIINDPGSADLEINPILLPRELIGVE